jgi:hypothetical protein
MSEATNPPAVGNPAGTGTRVNAAGVAFGELVKQIGSAVADTQARLNEITADTALALANTNIDVIAARQTKYNNDGTVDKVDEISLTLPLAAYVPLVNHEVSNVHIQAVFQSSGFQSESTNTTDSSYRPTSAQLLIGAPFGGGSTTAALARGAEAVRTGSGTGYGYETTTHTENGFTRNQESSYGQVRMNAEIRPREDIGVPRPTQVIRGPELTLTPGAGEESLTGEVVTERRLVLTINYRRRAGEGADAGKGIAGKSFAIEAPGLIWTPSDSGGVASTPATIEALKKTDPNGKTYILLRRDLRGEGIDRTPRPFVVTARIGMVHTNTMVML